MGIRAHCNQTPLEGSAVSPRPSLSRMASVFLSFDLPRSPRRPPLLPPLPFSPPRPPPGPGPGPGPRGPFVKVISIDRAGQGPLESHPKTQIGSDSLETLRSTSREPPEPLGNREPDTFLPEVAAASLGESRVPPPGG